MPCGADAKAQEKGATRTVPQLLFRLYGVGRVRIGHVGGLMIMKGSSAR